MITRLIGAMQEAAPGQRLAPAANAQRLGQLPATSATAATGVRDLRDCLHAATLPVADRDRNIDRPSSLSPTLSLRTAAPTD
jgi:hypothetical protein